KDDSPQSWKEFFIAFGAASDIKFRLFNNCNKAELLTFPNMQNYLEYLKREENIPPMGYQKWKALPDFSIENFLTIDFIDHLVNENYAAIFWELIAKEWQKILNMSSRLISLGLKSIPIQLTYLQFIVRETPCKNSSGKKINIQNLFAPSMLQYIGTDIQTMPIATIEHTQLTPEQEKYFGFKTALTAKECLEILAHLNSLSVSSSLNRYSAILKYLAALETTLSNSDKESIKLWNGSLPARDNTLHPTRNLFYLNAPILGSAGYAKTLLKRFPKLTASEMSKLSAWFGIREFQVEQLLPIVMGARPHDVPKERLYNRLAVIAYSEALQRGEKKPDELLRTLYERLKPYNFISAAQILLDFGNGDGPPVRLHIYKNVVYFINYYDRESNKALFSEAIHQILGLSIELRDLQPLIYLAENELKDWYQEQAIDEERIKTLRNKVLRWARTNAFSDSNTAPVIETHESYQENNLEKSSAIDNESSIVTTSSVTTPSPNPTTPLSTQKINLPAQQPASRNANHNLPPQQPLSRNSNNNLAANINPQSNPTRLEPNRNSTRTISYFTFKPSQKTSAQPTLKTLTLDAYIQHQVGILGEKTVFLMLMKHYQTKYPSFKLTETQKGFNLSGTDPKQKPMKIQVEWCNKTTESGKPYDFVISKTGKPERVIEVKATITADKTEFEVSHDQWGTMHRLGARFRFFRVFDTGQEDITITKIKDPAKLLEEGKIRITDLKITI
ncbi:MAG: DUF3883 domain-containing protein, partial [Proteobacteria bacterium]|nr:DUF3883 domain-containing protein [Pseudomonadota bacterium]